MRKIIVACIFILTVFLNNRCTVNNTNISDNVNFISGIAQPVTINPDTTTIFSEDFVSDPSLIDSFSFHPMLKNMLISDKKSVKLICGEHEKLPVISEMKIWSKGNHNSVLIKKSKKISHTFSYDAKGKKYSKLQLAGDFNNWNPNESNMSLTNDKWKISLLLNPGRYSYQIVADGKWMLDSGNPVSVSNGMGGFNSSIVVGNPEQKVPHISGKTISAKRFSFISDQELDEVFILWQNIRLDNNYIQKKNSEYEVILPNFCENPESSRVRIFAYNKNGESNDLIIPLKNGKIIDDSSFLSRSDKEAQVLYFLLVDRFNNGNTSNDQPVKDAEVHPKANYMGGDIKGIIKKIDDGFFQKLGVNTIWLSPVHQNPLTAYVEFPEPHRKFSGYHGYWPVHITKIDHRFGTNAEMKELVEKAHANNMNILVDFVANHLHEESPIIKKNPHWATQLNLPDGRKNIRLWDEYRLTTWFDTFLPTLDLEKKEVYDCISDSAIFFLKTFDIDGFRHDATKHIPEIFWRELTKKIKKFSGKKNNKSVYQIGETYGSRELIGSYVGSGKMDGQFDFNLFFDAKNTFIKDDNSFVNLKNSLIESLSYYGHNHLMGNITGNHDQARVISYAGEGLRFDEDEKEAGWKRDVKVENPVGYKKLSALTAFILTIPGVPVIYYGDEFGMPGAGDPDNRRMMKFDNLSKEEKTLREKTEKLVKLRRSSMPLIFGDFKFIEVTETEMIYTRSYFGQTVLVVFNKNAQKKLFKINITEIDKSEMLKPIFNSNYKINKSVLELEISGYSFDVFIL